MFRSVFLAVSLFASSAALAGAAEDKANIQECRDNGARSGSAALAWCAAELGTSTQCTYAGPPFFVAACRGRAKPSSSCAGTDEEKKSCLAIKGRLSYSACATDDADAEHFCVAVTKLNDTSCHKLSDVRECDQAVQGLKVGQDVTIIRNAIAGADLAAPSAPDKAEREEAYSKARKLAENLTLEFTLSRPSLKSLFEEFGKSEFSSENMKLHRAIKLTGNPRAGAACKLVMDVYFGLGNVNAGHTTNERLTRFNQLDGDVTCESTIPTKPGSTHTVTLEKTIHSLHIEVTNLLKDTLSRFKSSDILLDWLVINGA